MYYVTYVCIHHGVRFPPALCIHHDKRLLNSSSPNSILSFAKPQPFRHHTSHPLEKNYDRAQMPPPTPTASPLALQWALVALALLGLARSHAFIPETALISARPHSPKTVTFMSFAENSHGVAAPFDHSDITWKLRPPPETSLLKRAAVRLASAVIKLDCKLRRRHPPPVLCPKGGKAVLRAYHGGKQVGRFGVTTVRGPPAPQIDQSIRDLYGEESTLLGSLAGAGIAAIIYMFVEEEYRGRNVGELALEAIAALHTVQGCDFTVLVADDNGSGKLVEWYEKHGFKRAPLLQDMMGSPGASFGVSMMAPAKCPPEFFDRCRIRW